MERNVACESGIPKRKKKRLEQRNVGSLTISRCGGSVGSLIISRCASNQNHKFTGSKETLLKDIDIKLLKVQKKGYKKLLKGTCLVTLADKYISILYVLAKTIVTRNHGLTYFKP